MHPQYFCSSGQLQYISPFTGEFLIVLYKYGILSFVTIVNTSCTDPSTFKELCYLDSKPFSPYTYFIPENVIIHTEKC